MNIGMETIFNNIGVTFENTLLFILLVANLMIYAKDFKIGLIFQFVITGSLFMWFFTAEYNWIPSLVVMLMTLVLLAFTLYPVSRVSEQGGFI